MLNVLSEDDIQRIHEASLELLEEPGILTRSPLIAQIFSDAGAPVDRDSGMIRIPRQMVQDALDSAPSSFVFYGRDPQMDLLLEQSCVYFGMGGSAVPFFWDPDEQRPREPTKADMVAATRLGHALPNVDFMMSLAAAGDVPDELHYFHEYDAILRNTTKPIIYSAPGRRYAARFLEMAAAATGGEEALRKRPSVMLFTQTVSPLELSEYSEGMAEFAALGAPILSSPGPMMGATCPATLAGSLVQGNAETLAGVVLSQICKPGTPVVYGPHTPVMDMRSTRCTYAGTEQTLARAGMSQLARFYDLPSFGVGAGTDSKIPDGQAAAESMMGILMNALAGQTLTQTMGTMAGGSYGSLEMLVICDEIVAMVKHILRGIAVTDDTLAVDVIREAGPGGHFLDREHTLQMFRSEFFFPGLFDRKSIAQWQDLGGKRIDEVASERVKDLLGEATALVLPGAADRELARCLEDAEQEFLRGLDSAREARARCLA